MTKVTITANLKSSKTLLLASPTKYVLFCFFFSTPPDKYIVFFSLTNKLTQQTYICCRCFFFIIISNSYSSNGDLLRAFVLKTITLVGILLCVSSLILSLIRTAEYRSQ